MTHPAAPAPSSPRGLDGAGKSTVVRLLKRRFPDFVFTKEPTRKIAVPAEPPSAKPKGGLHGGCAKTTYASGYN